MNFYSRFRDMAGAGDDLVGIAAGEAAQDFQLTAREYCCTIAAASRRSAIGMDRSGTYLGEFQGYAIVAQNEELLLENCQIQGFEQNIARVDIENVGIGPASQDFRNIRLAGQTGGLGDNHDLVVPRCRQNLFEI